MHKKVIISSTLEKNIQLRFSHDSNRQIDLANGTLSTKKTTLYIKYIDKVKFCFEVAIINDKSIQLPPFECANKKIIVHKSYVNLV